MTCSILVHSKWSQIVSYCKHLLFPADVDYVSLKRCHSQRVKPASTDDILGLSENSPSVLC